MVRVVTFFDRKSKKLLKKMDFGDRSRVMMQAADLRDRMQAQVNKELSKLRRGKK